MVAGAEAAALARPIFAIVLLLIGLLAIANMVFKVSPFPDGREERVA
ncbi:hypothetical protein [Noviherbaspirillum cavernae]|nr:hypothetical protein [Noviherbaspirillum cavernae]